MVGCTSSRSVVQPRGEQPPDFGPNVLILAPGDPAAQAKVDGIFAQQESSQFGPDRFAILLAPGEHHVTIPVGFYTQVLGLGASPADTRVRGSITSKPFLKNRNATCNFWRSIENLTLTPDGGTNIWAVSQGTWLRRVHVRGDIIFSDGGWSSGGFLADSRIDGIVDSGTQQQWFSRNTSWGQWHGGNWNMVFVGVENPPPGQWPEKPYTTVDAAPVVREKPYLSMEGDRFAVRVPGLTRDARGPTWGGNDASVSATAPREGTSLGIESFYIAHAGRDTAASINEALASGKNLLLTPGLYELDAPIEVTRPGTVVLGLGYPTLTPTRGNAALAVGDVDGATIAGIIFEGSEIESPDLVQVGPSGASTSHKQSPTLLADITCRTGGARNGRAGSLLTINSKDVIIDNAWLWRADHGEGAAWDSNTTRNALVVNGDDVTAYALFAEHTQQYQTLWNANGGRVYFYQSEMPYDPPSPQAWSHDGITGYASYKVSPNVTMHEAWGLGIYCVFRGSPVIAHTAIEAPEGPQASGVKFHHVVTIRLNGLPDSGIAHVINDRGEPVVHSKKATID